MKKTLFFVLLLLLASCRNEQKTAASENATAKTPAAAWLTANGIIKSAAFKQPSNYKTLFNQGSFIALEVDGGAMIWLDDVKDSYKGLAIHQSYVADRSLSGLQNTLRAAIKDSWIFSKNGVFNCVLEEGQLSFGDPSTMSVPEPITISGCTPNTLWDRLIFIDTWHVVATCCNNGTVEIHYTELGLFPASSQGKVTLTNDGVILELEGKKTTLKWVENQIKGGKFAVDAQGKEHSFTFKD